MSVHIFLNGKWQQVSSKDLLMFSPGIICARGAFETMRVHDGTIVSWEKHINRLRRGLHFFGMKTPFSQTKLQTLCQTVLRKNSLNNARIRIACWKDQNKNCFSITAQPRIRYTQRDYQKGFSVSTSTYKRNRTAYSHLKTMYYEVFYKAFREAFKIGYDEAILLNKQGRVVEGSRANIFCIKDNSLITPSVQSGCLNGITRQAVIDIARTQKWNVCIGDCTKRTFQKTDEVFLTNSVLGVMAVTKWDGVKIGNAKEGVKTQMIRTIYNKTLL